MPMIIACRATAGGVSGAPPLGADRGLGAVVPHEPSLPAWTQTTTPFDLTDSGWIALSVSVPVPAREIVALPDASVSGLAGIVDVTPPATSPIDAPATGSPVRPSVTCTVNGTPALALAGADSSSRCARLK